MVRIRRFILLLSCGVLLGTPAISLPVEPDVKKILEEADKPPIHYPIARVGWAPSVSSAIPKNLTYERMRYPWTPEGLRAQLISYSIPDWKVWALFGLLIFTLRYYRYTKPLEEQRKKVLRFPAKSPVPTKEAA
jgi:hypothetical protein